MLWTTLGSFQWSGALFLATIAPSFAVSSLLTDSVMFGASLGTVAYLLFALEYTGRERFITRRLVAVLAAVPFLNLAIALTNPWGSFYQYLVPDPSHPTGVSFEYGPLFWIVSAPHYALLLGGAAIIIGMVYRTRAMYKGQVIALVGSVAAALFTSLISNLGLVPFDTTPIGFVLGNALLTVAVTRYHLIDLSPIARSFVLDEISDGVLVVDDHHRVVDVNAAGGTMLNRMRGEESTMDSSAVVGKPVSTLLADQPTVEAEYWAVIEERTQQEVELAVAGRYYSLTASPLEDGRGRHVGWLFLFRDVTERKQREDELRRRNEQLDQFANVVSHDLRNPLGIAKGYVDLVEETGEVELLEEVTEAHERMEAIITDVLELAREGSTVTDPDPVSLGTVAERAWANVETGGASLRVADDATILADPDRLTRLLENLYRNTMEHGRGDVPAGEEPPEITVTVGRTDAGFYVADDGAGIPADLREQIFETGYSGGEGTGFGLSIVEQIAGTHGWTVRVTEGTDGGARFEFAGVAVPPAA